MNLKYSSIFLFIATSLFGSNALAENTVNFKGKIVESSCSVKFNGSTVGNVDLGTWPKSTFGVAGDKSTPIPLTITVSDCAEGSNGVKGYYMDFNVEKDNSNTDLIVTTGTATGVGVGISHLGDYNSKIKLNVTHSNDFTIDEDAKTGTLLLQAFYQQSSGAAVTAGSANATAIVSVSMK